MAFAYVIINSEERHYRDFMQSGSFLLERLEHLVSDKIAKRLMVFVISACEALEAYGKESAFGLDKVSHQI
jgi:hypothetical protein